MWHSRNKCNISSDLEKNVRTRFSIWVAFWVYGLFMFDHCELFEIISMNEECLGRHCRMNAFCCSMCGFSLEVYDPKYIGILWALHLLLGKYSQCPKASKRVGNSAVDEQRAEKAFFCWKTANKTQKNRFSTQKPSTKTQKTIFRLFVDDFLAKKSFFDSLSTNSNSKNDFLALCRELTYCR